MPRISLIASLVAIFGLMPALAQDSAAKTPLARVILVTQSKGFVHDVIKRQGDRPSRVEQTFLDLASKTGMFTLETTDDVTTLTREKLRETSIVAFYTTGELPFT